MENKMTIQQHYCSVMSVKLSILITFKIVPVDTTVTFSAD